MNPALINFNAHFSIHPDKISARNMSYVQLQEFEAAVSFVQKRASRPKPGIKWIWADLPCWMQFFRNKFREECGVGCKKQSWRERGLLKSVSLHRGIMSCMEEKRLLYRLSWISLFYMCSSVQFFCYMTAYKIFHSS